MLPDSYLETIHLHQPKPPSILLLAGQELHFTPRPLKLVLGIMAMTSQDEIQDAHRDLTELPGTRLCRFVWFIAFGRMVFFLCIFFCFVFCAGGGVDMVKMIWVMFGTGCFFESLSEEVRPGWRSLVFVHWRSTKTPGEGSYFAFIVGGWSKVLLKCCNLAYFACAGLR